MHVAEHCITDLASALAVAKVLGQRHVIVRREVYEKIWHSKYPGHKCHYGWSSYGGGIAVICDGCWNVNIIKERWDNEANNT